MSNTITFSYEGVWKKSCVVFRLLLMAVFAFSVSGEYPCQSEFIPPSKLRTRRLNALKVHVTTASMKIQRWTNKEITSIISRWQMTIGLIFTLFLFSLNKKIVSVE